MLQSEDIEGYMICNCVAILRSHHQDDDAKKLHVSNFDENGNGWTFDVDHLDSLYVVPTCECRGQGSPMKTCICVPRSLCLASCGVDSGGVDSEARTQNIETGVDSDGDGLAHGGCSTGAAAAAEGWWPRHGPPVQVVAAATTGVVTAIVSAAAAAGKAPAAAAAAAAAGALAAAPVVVGGHSSGRS